MAEFEDSLELAEVDGNRIDAILVDDTHLYYSGQSEKDKRKYQIFSVPITEKDGARELIRFSIRDDSKVF